jgi:hypothetical protein
LVQLLATSGDRHFAYAHQPRCAQVLHERKCSISAPSPREEAMMTESFVLQSWRGAAPLWRVYWLYGVLGSAVLTVLIVAPTLMGWYTPPMVVLALAIGLVYTAWIVVSTWRCAFNIKDEPLGIPRDTLAMLARWLTVAWSINVLGLSVMLLQSVIAT